MRRFIPYLSVAVFAAALAFSASALASYQLSGMEPVQLTGQGAKFTKIEVASGYELGTTLFGIFDEPELIVEESIEIEPEVQILRRKMLVMGILKDDFRASAIIKDVSGDSIQIFYLGSKVFGPEYIKEVQPGSIILTSRRGERTLYLGQVSEADKAPVVAKAKPKRKRARKGMRISKAEINASASSPEEIIGKSKIVPEIGKGGKIVGFKLLDVQAGSIIQKMGIESGDVIKQVNGYPLNDLARAPEILQKLKTASEIHMLVKRNGQDKAMSYYIDD
ncbi:MAG: hypothetical protein JKX97_07830 [Candidatus Lindowbacteria bacterium]|nr:hypothetical protein [Candidatus Lindowbacteria bacterium]